MIVTQQDRRFSRPSSQPEAASQHDRGASMLSGRPAELADRRVSGWQVSGAPGQRSAGAADRQGSGPRGQPRSPMTAAQPYDCRAALASASLNMTAGPPASPSLSTTGARLASLSLNLAAAAQDDRRFSMGPRPPGMTDCFQQTAKRL